MLGGKNQQIKELSERVETLESKLRNLQESTEYATQKKDEELSNFTQLTASFAQLDAGLTKVVDHIRAAGDMTKEEGSLVSSLGLLMAELDAALLAEQKHVSTFVAQTKTHAKSVTDIVEKNKYFTTPTKSLISETDGMKKSLTDTRQMTEELKEYFRNMSVTALHAAIEAGRMGEAGTGFLSVAEEIRTLSEEKERQAEEILARIDDTDAHIQTMSEQIEKITSLLKENNIFAVKLAKDQETTMTQFETTGYGAASAHMKHTQESLDAVKKSQSQIFAHENDALDEMDEIGAAFMDGQKVLEESETLYRDMMDRIEGGKDNG